MAKYKIIDNKTESKFRRAVEMNLKVGQLGRFDQQLVADI